MKYSHQIDTILERATFSDQGFEWVHYDEVRFWSCRYERCVWNHCRFNKTMFCQGTVFLGCRFVNCRFWGQHTHLGGPSLFEHCSFENCRFEDVSFWEATFRDCLLSGLLRNVAFHGLDAPKGWATIMSSVDLSHAVLEDVLFHPGFDLSSVKLP